jgi:hypothetical protein
VLDQLPAAGRSIDAREHARICGRVDDPIDLPDSFQIARATEIAVAKLDPSFPERFEIERAPSPSKIVESDNLAVRHVIEKPVGEGGPDETADSGDEDFHSRFKSRSLF